MWKAYHPSMTDTTLSESRAFGERASWRPVKPKIGVARFCVHTLTAALAVLITAYILPGISVGDFLGALAVAVVIGILNAVLPPLVAALPIPLMALAGFVIVLLVDAAVIKLASDLTDNAITVSNFGFALLAAIVISAVTIVLEIHLWHERR